jgi:hypothetical protein
MKKILAFVAVAFLMGGCATFDQNVKTAWAMLTGASVSPTQIIVAGNAFDALEATATQYLLYCKSVKYAIQVCALGNRKPVVAAVRSGRAARNQLEPYVVSGTAGPSAIYNTLAAAINTLQSFTMPTGAK